MKQEIKGLLLGRKSNQLLTQNQITNSHKSSDNYDSFLHYSQSSIRLNSCDESNNDDDSLLEKPQQIKREQDIALRKLNFKAKLTKFKDYIQKKRQNNEMIGFTKQKHEKQYLRKDKNSNSLNASFQYGQIYEIEKTKSQNNSGKKLTKKLSPKKKGKNSISVRTALNVTNSTSPIKYQRQRSRDQNSDNKSKLGETPSNNNNKKIQNSNYDNQLNIIRRKSCVCSRCGDHSFFQKIANNIHLASNKPKQALRKAKNIFRIIKYINRLNFDDDSLAPKSTRSMQQPTNNSNMQTLQENDGFPRKRKSNFGQSMSSSNNKLIEPERTSEKRRSFVEGFIQQQRKSILEIENHTTFIKVIQDAVKKHEEEQVQKDQKTQLKKQKKMEESKKKIVEHSNYVSKLLKDKGQGNKYLLDYAEQRRKEEQLKRAKQKAPTLVKFLEKKKFQIKNSDSSQNNTPGSSNRNLSQEVKKSLHPALQQNQKQQQQQSNCDSKFKQTSQLRNLPPEKLESLKKQIQQQQRNVGNNSNKYQKLPSFSSFTQAVNSHNKTETQSDSQQFTPLSSNSLLQFQQIQNHGNMNLSIPKFPSRPINPQNNTPKYTTQSSVGYSINIVNEKNEKSNVFFEDVVKKSFKEEEEKIMEEEDFLSLSQESKESIVLSPSNKFHNSDLYLPKKKTTSLVNLYDFVHKRENQSDLKQQSSQAQQITGVHISPFIAYQNNSTKARTQLNLNKNNQFKYQQNQKQTNLSQFNKGIKLEKGEKNQIKESNKVKQSNNNNNNNNMNESLREKLNKITENSLKKQNSKSKSIKFSKHHFHNNTYQEYFQLPQSAQTHRIKNNPGHSRTVQSYHNFTQRAQTSTEKKRKIHHLVDNEVGNNFNNYGRQKQLIFNNNKNINKYSSARHILSPSSTQTTLMTEESTGRQFNNYFTQLKKIDKIQKILSKPLQNFSKQINKNSTKTLASPKIVLSTQYKQTQSVQDFSTQSPRFQNRQENLFESPNKNTTYFRENSSQSKRRRLKKAGRQIKSHDFQIYGYV